MTVLANWLIQANPIVSTGQSLLDVPYDSIALAAAEDLDRLSSLIQHLGGCLSRLWHTFHGTRFSCFTLLITLP